ncbi:MAG: hypothetical protein QNJ16_06440 [Rhodobacter sp.]|nr:hypothetical protein [Rhodobacter sp.]
MAQNTKKPADTKSTQIVHLKPRIEADRRARRLPPMDEVKVTQLFNAHDALRARPLAA